MIVIIIPNICFIVYLSPKINVLVKNNKNREVNLINNEFNNGVLWFLSSSNSESDDITVIKAITKRAPICVIDSFL